MECCVIPEERSPYIVEPCKRNDGKVCLGRFAIHINLTLKGDQYLILIMRVANPPCSENPVRVGFDPFRYINLLL